MRMKWLALIVAIAFLPSFGATSAAAKQSRVIYLVAKVGGARIATIHSNGESILGLGGSKR
jgi:hypothetical protein